MFSKKFFFKKNSYSAGFTFIELLVVISIIVLLSTVAMVAVDKTRRQTIDVQRLVDMKKIEAALELYYDKNRHYPDTNGNGCGGWNVGNKTLSFMQGSLPNVLEDPPEDPLKTGTCYGYRYYRYVPDNPTVGIEGCPAGKSFYVLGITDLEASQGSHFNSPGWSCPDRNWQNEMEWVTGKFEN
ncbi:type II secretion system GspH family protein [Patescibacteria group bacterium]|nr:type II secretion system GspH family protein [Patescibacteria group bacterium]